MQIKLQRRATTAAALQVKHRYCNCSNDRQMDRQKDKKPSCHWDSRAYHLTADYLVISDCSK